MIIVLTGTNPYCFERLVKAVDAWVQISQKEVFVQLGNTKYEPKNCKFERFLNRKRLLALISNAELVISQGGFGSLRDCLGANRKVIAVPRFPALGESTDCQEELVRALEQQGRLIAVYDIRDLPKAIGSISEFQPKQGQPSRVVHIIEEFLDSLS
jgi:beta-1,4-N-acetylglucosaminyltransferase